MKIETRQVDVSERRRFGPLVEWLRESYGRRMVMICDGAEVVAYMAGPEFAGLIERLARTWHERRPPFTREALDEWAADLLAEIDLSDLLAADDTNTNEVEV